MPATTVILILLGAYLVGGLPTGLLVARSRGVDIRGHGSGNYGATNVARVLGRGWGILVFLLDVAKGAATIVSATLLANRGVLGPAVSTTGRDLLWLGVGFCCILGNTLPVYLKFRGGKGVATSLGVVLAIWPYMTVPALCAFAVWALVTRITGFVSLGSILAAAALPVAFVAASRISGWPLDQHYPLLLLCLALAALVWIRHRANIGRLLAGTENRIGKSASNGKVA